MSTHNLLPYDGEVIYIPKAVEPIIASRWYEQLHKEINWQHDIVKIFGKEIITKRMSAWYGDLPYAYRYSHVTRIAEHWSETLAEIKTHVEQLSDDHYNSCLLNLYHDGTEGMGWHSDNEPELQVNGTIASVSLGAHRRFDLRHRQTKEKVSVLLDHGSLLLMKGTTQAHWVHQLAKTKKINTARINLTFRTIMGTP